MKTLGVGTIVRPNLLNVSRGEMEPLQALEILGAFRITNSAGAFGWVHTHVLC
jgi:hypothetical protein